MCTMTPIFILERQEREPEKSRDLHDEWGRIGIPTLSSSVHVFLLLCQQPSELSVVLRDPLISRAASQVHPQGLQWLSNTVPQEKVE